MAALVDIVEIDKMTGAERTIWMHAGIGQDEAEQAIEWRRKNITNRYDYRTVPTGIGPDAR